MLSFGGLGFGSFSGTFKPVDLTAPTLISAVLAADGLTLTLTYNEPLDATSEPAAGAYALAGTDSVVSSVNVTGSTVVLTLDTAAFEGEAITLDYTPGGAPVRDLAGNNAAALNDQAVANNSEIEESVSELIESLLLASDSYGDSNANASPLRTDLLTNPVTGLQHFAYHADNLPSTVTGKLALGTIGVDGTTVTIDKSAISTAAEDGHNFFALGFDGDGDRLISGDMHNVPLKFQRLAGDDIDIAGWMTPPLEPSATDESSVTYPTKSPPGFLASGDVLFIYRDGGSGDGKLVLKRWRRATNDMVLVGVIVNEPGESFYPHYPFWDFATQAIHMGGCFRRTTAINTNHDQAYWRVVTDDDWVTCRAERADGSAQTLPVTMANAEYALVTGENVGLINVGSIKLDAAGNPQLFFAMDPGDGFAQFYAVRHNGSAWVAPQKIPENAQLQNGKPFSYVGVTGDTRRAFGGPRVAPARSDRTILPTRSATEGDGVWALICERADLNEWTWKQLDADDTGNGWAASIDLVKWATAGEIHTTVAKCQIKLSGDADIGPQTIKRLRFRPQSAPYTYTPPAALFDPDSVAGCVAYIAPRVGGMRVHGGATAVSDLAREIWDARNGTVLVSQTTTSDAPLLVWDRFGKRRGGVLFNAATNDFMLGTPAALMSALGGVNTAFIFQFVWETTTVSTSQHRCISFSNGTNTGYIAIGSNASKFPVLERNVGGTVKQWIGNVALADNTKYLITAVFDGTNGYMLINSETTPQVAAANLSFAASASYTIMGWGCRRRAGVELVTTGYLGACRIGNVIPSDADIYAIRAAMAAEHGITL